MAKKSAGILLYRHKNGVFEVLLVHPGGPFWAKKDQHAWSIPKGEFGDEEEPLAAAKREFAEELGSPVPEGEYIELGQVKQSGGKIVHAWALQADFDAEHILSDTFSVEWPPGSGLQEFPEVDKAAWTSLKAAQTKLLKGQLPLLEKLTQAVGEPIDMTSEPEQASLF